MDDNGTQLAQVVYEDIKGGWWSVHCVYCKRGEAGSRRQIVRWADDHRCVTA